MTIAAIASQATGNVALTSPVSKAFAGNVTAGNLVTIALAKYTSTLGDTPIAGDCTQSAGTATLGTIALDAVYEYDTGGSGFVTVSIFSAIVTGTGSCTMQCASGDTVNLMVIGIDEYSATAGWDGSRLEDSAVNHNFGTAVDSGNADSAGGALFFGVCSSANNPTAITEDGAFTLIYENQTAASGVVASVIRRITSGTLTDSASWTYDASDYWSAAVAVYKEAAAAAAPAALLLLSGE